MGTKFSEEVVRGPKTLVLWLPRPVNGDIERMLTVSETSRLQKRSAFQWLCDAIEASLHGQPAPTLLNRP